MADCLHPVTIRNKGKGPAYIAVPCGKCPKCLATKLNKWVFRLKQHCKDYKYVSFVTLTYNDDNLPYCHIDENCQVSVIQHVIDENDTPCLNKKDLFKFFRDLRKYGKSYGIGKDFISYYAIGEYGPNPRDGKSDRPHYHIMLFSNYLDFDNPETLFLFDWIWSRGFVQFKPVTDFRIQYVCKHHLKPKNSKWFPVKQFTLRSNGLGLGFLDKDVVRWFKDNKPTVFHQRDGVKIGVPRYYRTKLMEMYGIDTSVAYIQRKTPQSRILDSYGVKSDKVYELRDCYEQTLENRNLYKSKNKRK